MRSSMRTGLSSTWRPIRNWYGPRAGIGSTSCKRASTRATMNRPRLRQRRLSRYWRGGLTARFLSRSRPANNEPWGNRRRPGVLAYPLHGLFESTEYVFYDALARAAQCDNFVQTEE